VAVPSKSELTGIIMVSISGYQVRGGIAFNFAALLSFARERERERGREKGRERDTCRNPRRGAATECGIRDFQDPGAV